MQSDDVSELTKALVKVQAVVEGAVKDKVNPHFKNRYADLSSVWEACRKPLTDNGLAVAQVLEADGATSYLKTTLLHTSGQWIASLMPLPCDQRNMQALGSAITYARRYSLAAIVGVCPEDDDGNAAGEAPARDEPRHQPQAARRESSPPPRHDGNGERRQYDGPPRSGKALFAALKELGNQTGQDWIKYANDLGNLQGFAGRITEWSPNDVTLVWNVVQRKRSGQPAPAADDSYDDPETPF